MPTHAYKKSKRKTVLNRDKYTCQYCGTKNGPFVIDHFIPISRGGSNNNRNLMTACEECDRRKGNSLPTDQLLAYLKAAKKGLTFQDFSATMQSRGVETTIHIGGNNENHIRLDLNRHGRNHLDRS